MCIRDSDNDEKNPTEIEGVPVLDISKKVYLNNEYPVYIATRGVNQEKLKNSLKLYGIKKIIPVDVQLDMKFRNAFIEKYYRSIDVYKRQVYRRATFGSWTVRIEKDSEKREQHRKLEISMLRQLDIEMCIRDRY